jgi:hypothetical protein
MSRLLNPSIFLTAHSLDPSVPDLGWGGKVDLGYPHVVVPGWRRFSVRRQSRSVDASGRMWRDGIYLIRGRRVVVELDLEGREVHRWGL